MNKYIEINSSYRDRNLWPIVGEFEIPIEQSGTDNTKENVTDPVCLGAPLFVWNPARLSPIAGPQIIGEVGSYGNIKYTSDQIELFIFTEVISGWPIQDLNNYLSGLILNNFGPNTTGISPPLTLPGTPVLSKNRIISSVYISESLFKLTIVQTNYVYNIGDVISINDPSDFSDLDYPLLFVPNGANEQNSYQNFIIYNNAINDYRNIKFYNADTKIINFDAIDNTWLIENQVYDIRKIPPIYPPRYADTGLSFVPLLNFTESTYSTIIFDATFPKNTYPLKYEINYYKNYYLRLVNTGVTTYVNNKVIPADNQVRRIINYTFIPDISYTFEVYPPFTGRFDIGLTLQILDFSYDNYNPFSYNGSLVSQQDMVCYDFELVDLVLPNATLTTGFGGKIAFYPFVYVQLSNVSSAGAGVKNVLYSNNPNSTNMIFRVPIIDIQDPFTTPFVRLTGNGVVQTIKFKPNDNLLFSVRLPNGNIYDTILEEYYSPFAPNFFAQISALFRITRH